MIEIKHAQNKLNEINGIFSDCKIPYVLQFDYVENINKEIITFDMLPRKLDLIFVLFVNDFNVASIQSKFKEDYIYILSKTHENYVRNKYNLLLRCVFILIAPYILQNKKNILNLRSFAISEFSENCLKKYFIVNEIKDDAYVFNLNVENNQKKSNEILQDLIKKYINTNKWHKN